MACALLAAACSDPAGVVEPRPGQVVFGPATVAFNARDFLPSGFPVEATLRVDVPPAS